VNEIEIETGNKTEQKKRIIMMIMMTRMILASNQSHRMKAKSTTNILQKAGRIE
jgi:hypothetical protein